MSRRLREKWDMSSCPVGSRCKLLWRHSMSISPVDKEANFSPNLSYSSLPCKLLMLQTQTALILMMMMTQKTLKPWCVRGIYSVFEYRNE
jgi:hypothetical protein